MVSKEKGGFDVSIFRPSNAGQGAYIKSHKKDPNFMEGTFIFHQISPAVLTATFSKNITPKKNYNRSNTRTV